MSYRVLETIGLDELELDPDIEYLIDDILQMSNVSLVYGETEIGKSFFMLHMALCVAYGIPFFGQPTRKGKVLYIYAEGRTGLKKRWQAWKQRYAPGDTTADIRFHTYPVHLKREKQVILDTIDAYPGGFDLVVVDTWAACTSGVSRVDPTAVKESLDVALEAVRETGCHFAISHHTNKEGAYGGTIAFKDNVFTMIELSREHETAPINVRCEKQRDDEKFIPFMLDLIATPVGFDAKRGKNITSCYLELSTQVGQRVSTSFTAKNSREVARAILEDRGPSTNGQWQEACNEAGMSQTNYKNSRDDLLSQGKVELTIGKSNKHIYAFTLTQEEQEAEKQKAQQQKVEEELTLQFTGKYAEEYVDLDDVSRVNHSLLTQLIN